MDAGRGACSKSFKGKLVTEKKIDLDGRANLVEMVWCAEWFDLGGRASVAVIADAGRPASRSWLWQYPRRDQ